VDHVRNAFGQSTCCNAVASHVSQGLGRSTRFLKATGTCPVERGSGVWSRCLSSTTIPTVFEVLSEALTQPGLEILTATDPEVGIDLFWDRRPPIVLTDLVMREMGGLDVLERIMEIDPATEVILITAHYSSETAVEAIKKGATDYLNKPVPLKML
jgi:CheY-like chemotaxis protein